MAIHLNQIVPWGRTGEEYSLMFDLAAAELSQGILDCGGGTASFTGELTARGNCAVAIDPIYAFSASDFRTRFEATVQPIRAQVRATPQDWVWRYHRDPDALLRNRRTAIDRVLDDFETGLAAHRCVTGVLPSLPFCNREFGLAVCSHLLFLYSDDHLTKEFHIHAVHELCRVAREVGIFPLLDLRWETSPPLAAVRAAAEADGRKTQVVDVDYELQRGGNQILKFQRLP